ncbi:MAG: DUF2459 domain-containing protein [Bacteriovoracia bacterium]
MNLLISLISIFIFASCSSEIVCPQVSQTSNIALVDHGRHASLIVENEDNEMTCYSYGDWDFYALAQPNFWNGFKALFWPTQAGLGRKELPGPVTNRNIKLQLKVLTEEIFILKVDKNKLARFRERIDRVYFKNSDSLHYNKSYDLNFVHYPATYWVFNNSNQITSAWLEELGCKVSGPSLFSSWEVRK